MWQLLYIRELIASCLLLWKMGHHRRSLVDTEKYKNLLTPWEDDLAADKLLGPVPAEVISPKVDW